MRGWFVVAMVCAGAARAAEAPPAVVAEQPRWLGLEVDPPAFAFRGFSVHGEVKPDALGRFSVGFGAFTLQMPGLYMGKNASEGWSARMSAAGLETRYFFSAERRGFHLGALLYYWVFDFARAEGSTQVQNLGLAPIIGYQWFPFRSYGLYLRAVLGASLRLTTSGSDVVAGQTYQRLPIDPLAGIHVGWAI